PVGADAPGRRVNARVITATNRNLTELVENGTFREDVLYRIQVGRIHVPPLRDRPDDVRALVEQMVKRSGRAVRFSEDALAALAAYPWPGNVWELRNVVERAMWTSDNDVIEPAILKIRGARDRHAGAKPNRRSKPDDRRRVNR